VTAGHGSAAVTESKADFSAGAGEVSATPAENFSARVDDESLIALISAGLVGVHRSGSRQRKGGAAYDYRSHYRALRLNCPPRTVLAFGTPERLQEKLASLGIHLCFDHPRARLSMGKKCDLCRGREAVKMESWCR